MHDLIEQQALIEAAITRYGFLTQLKLLAMLR